ncbi:class I SAM-dependent methyltransferase [Halotia wernerae UHCC 0503]|nr:class I SAM-dependent methyltransferase [Halotia wernerae UHCC 0503]
MIESNNPEINVDELMQKIREEVANRQGNSRLVGIKTNVDTANLMSHLAYIESLLKNAESRSYIRTKWPDKLNRFPFNLNSSLQKFILKLINFFFKDQREVNFNLILSFKESIALNRQLIEQIKTLKVQMDESLSAVDSNIQGMDERLSAVDSNIQGIDNGLNTIDNWISTWITTIEENLNNLNTRIQEMHERLNTVDNSIQDLDERHVRNYNYLKNDLMQQKRMIFLFLEEARRRFPEPFNPEQLQTFINEDRHLLDAFYVAFEDQFRGSREQIHDRLKVYLPLIEKTNFGKTDSPILDVGCGRGEWLQLLRESGYKSIGIDINRVMLEQCRDINLEVIESDAIAYLQSLPDESLGIVTGFHIIEHLPLTILINLIYEILRVLKPGGLAIFETPNPQNILVGTNNFYIDPTHLNPLPSPLVKFILEYAGFNAVEVMNLNPYEDSFKVSGSDVADLFNQYFYGPQDYGVIGRKI